MSRSRPKHTAVKKPARHVKHLRRRERDEWQDADDEAREHEAYMWRHYESAGRDSG